MSVAATARALFSSPTVAANGSSLRLLFQDNIAVDTRREATTESIIIDGEVTGRGVKTEGADTDIDM